MDTQVITPENRTTLADSAVYFSPSSPPLPVGNYSVTPEAELEFHEVGAALMRRRYLIVTLAVLGFLGGLIAALTTHKTYSATATVEFAQPNAHALGLDDPSSNASDLSTLELLNTELKTEQTEITDDTTALAVIRQLHLEAQQPFAIPAGLDASQPLGRERGLPLERAPYQRERVLKLFQQHLGVEVVKGTRLLNITFTDEDPVRAAAVANAVVSASIEGTSGRHNATFSQVNSWLTEQLASLKGRVEDNQKQAEAYEEANQRDLAGMTIATSGAGQGGRIDAPSASESVPVSRLLALNNELTSAEVARVAKEAIYRVVQSGDPEAVLSIGSSSLVSGQGADSTLAPGNGGLTLLQHLREQQVQANVQAATAAAKYGAKNQVMVEFSHQQAALDGQITVELGRIRERASKDLDLAIGAENGLRAKVTAQQGEVSQWTTKADHLLLLQGEAASTRALYQDLFAKLEESQFAAGIRASRVSVLDPARVPTVAAGPNKRMDLALGLLVGLVLGFVGAFLVELVDDSLHSVEQIRKAFGTPVLGSIPKFPRGTDGIRAWVVDAPRSVTAEAYRSLRTSTFAPRARHHCKTLLIASARPAEGKATTCLNAAASLAVQGHRVLMLNADMRRARPAEPFNLAANAGLSGYLRGQVSAEQAVRPSGDIDNLYVLPAGVMPENPSELLSSKSFAALVGELKASFDYILMDSPPALLFTDTRILAAHADAYLLVVSASCTRKADLQRTLDMLGGVSATFLGIVFNGARLKLPSYAKVGYGTYAA